MHTVVYIYLTKTTLFVKYLSDEEYRLTDEALTFENEPQNDK